MSEAIARAWIGEVIGESGATPTAPQAITISRGKRLQADVGLSGARYAIAYVVAGERRELGGSVPPYDVGNSALVLVRGSEDPNVRVLILHDLAYQTDEQAGGDRELSSVVVKQRLQRDVRDFLAEAKRRGWP